jgi:MoCo/4Fe-4S cofactor protein with predicted Tat translocation signal
MSKRILQHPEIPANETTRSWLNVGHLENSTAFKQVLQREFVTSATRMENEEDAENSRRNFLKLMGASTMLGGLAACRRPEKYTVPYNQAPEWVIPGKALYYASAMPSAAGAVPLVVTSFEGRPTKLAPNALHPDTDGTDAFAQASILDLYSPSRSRSILYKGAASDLSSLEKALVELGKTGKIALVFGADESPTRTRLVKDLVAKISGLKAYAYEPLASANAATRNVVDFSKADRILALDCDFCALDRQGPVAPFFQRRKPEGKGYKAAADAKSMNRLYSVESLFTLTGGMADHRLRVAPSQVENIAANILSKLGQNVSGSAPITDAKHAAWIDAMVKDLQQNKGRSVVVAGSRTSPALQAIVAAINTALGSYGSTLATFSSLNSSFGDIASLKNDLQSGAVENIIFLTPANPVFDAPSDYNFADLVSKAKTSIHLGMRTDATAHACTWHIPAAHYLESWADARSSSGVVTLMQPMILPLYDHCVTELELLSTLLEGKLITGDDSSGYQAVRTTAGGADSDWKKSLRQGFIPGAAATAAVTPSANLSITAASAPTLNSLDIIFSTDGSIYDGRFIDNAWLQESPDPISKIAWDNAAFIAPKTAKELGIYDQVIALENQRAAAPVDGESGNRRAPIIAVSLAGKTIEIPIHIAFGLAENTVVIPVGYGQGYDKENDFEIPASNATHVGLVGVNRGVNVYPLRTSATTYMAQGAKVTKTDKRYFLAYTQEHHAMYGRALAREISTMDVAGKGDFDKQYEGVALQGNDSHAPPNYSLYKQEGSSTWDPDKKGNAKPLLSDTLHQWAMNIDLSSCMGCNACLVACQAENNIPVVGKDQLAKGRAMHWIRMDRYFAQHKDTDFDVDSPAMVPQPVACVQCESAPCETVCPVNATVHTEDGLNAMAYNRCIGTRYCANNCPYKARRFNYFDYNKRNPLIESNLYKGPFGETQIGKGPHLQRNPNVTVRMRGVMEKCTYCVQRLKDAQIRQKRGHKQDVLASGKTSPEVTVTTQTLRVPVDSIKVACQEACPADAITFGNKLDGKDSAIGRARDLKRSYELLHYIGTIPRTLYMARVKNPNAAMPGAKFIGLSTINMH